jgi:hypothetical protein
MLLAHLLEPFDLFEEFWHNVKGHRGEFLSRMGYTNEMGERC